MLYATRAEYTFLSFHGTFTKTEYILGHKTYLNKYENTKIIQAMLLRPQRHKWQPTPVLLPGELHGQRSLLGYSPWGRKESDTTERILLNNITIKK